MPTEFDEQRVVAAGPRRGPVVGRLAIGAGAVLVALVGAGIVHPPSAASVVREPSRCTAGGALDTDLDCRLIIDVVSDDAVWSAEFARRGLAYAPPRFELVTGPTQTGCGQGDLSVGPFYCPPDRELYLDVAFFDQLRGGLGSGWGPAGDYVVAHEFGHHLQTLLGIEPRVRAAQQRDPELAARYRVGLELQADCYAGVSTRLVGAAGHDGPAPAPAQPTAAPTAALTAALTAVEQLGDGAVDTGVPGQVNPESFTRGGATQRQAWFATGWTSGDLDACAPFASLGLPDPAPG